jgi:hypothetical protein
VVDAVEVTLETGAVRVRRLGQGPATGADRASGADRQRRVLVFFPGRPLDEGPRSYGRGVVRNLEVIHAPTVATTCYSAENGGATLHAAARTLRSGQAASTPGSGVRPDA